MPSINVDLDYFDHPKTLRLVGLLGRGAEVLPIRLWIHCGGFHAETGKLTGYSAQEIEAVLRWWGRTSECVDAMVRVGFIDQAEDGSLSVHDWVEHGAHLLVYRAKATAAARARWDRAKCLTDAPSIPQAMPQASPKQCHSSAVQGRAEKKTKAKDTGAKTAPEPTKAISDPANKPPHVQFMDQFMEFYQQQTEEPYKADKEEFVLAAGLIKKHGAEVVAKKASTLAKLCLNRSAWFTKDGWASFTIKKLSSQWNSIIGSGAQLGADEEFLAELKKQGELRERTNELLQRR